MSDVWQCALHFFTSHMFLQCVHKTSHSFMRSSRAESITAAISWLAFLRLVATCPQLGSTNHLEHAQVRPGTHSFLAKSATPAGCCRPGSVQCLRPGVQMSALDGSWISVYLLPTRLRHLWPSPPAMLTVVISISNVWDLLRTEDVHLHTPALRIGTHFLLILETVVFLFRLLSTTSKPFSSLSTRLAHTARLGFFYKKTRYINSLLLTL